MHTIYVYRRASSAGNNLQAEKWAIFAEKYVNKLVFLTGCEL
jgi:hypothetical protein